MRPTRLVLPLLAAAAVSLPLPGAGTAAASCAAPQLRLADGDWGDGPAGEPLPTVVAGQRARVEGRSYSDGCDDHGGQSSLGCEEREEVSPVQDVELRLEQGSRSWLLGTTDADGELTTSWVVELPDDLRPGPARLVTDGAEALSVEVVAPR